MNLQKTTSEKLKSDGLIKNMLRKYTPEPKDRTHAEREQAIQDMIANYNNGVDIFTGQPLKEKFEWTK
jgi:hypothetical protein